MKTSKCHEKGQSLFEIVFVIAIVALILIGIVSLSVTSVRNSDTSSNQALAARYARETVDWLRQQRDVGWSNLATNSSAWDSAGPRTWCLESVETSWPASDGNCSATSFISETNLLREVSLQFTDVNNNKIKAGVSVRWIDSQGTHEKIINTTFIDWNQVESLY
jgi:type II secretory pathway pseudopilin PulG